MKVKEESGKVGLQLNIQKTKIMASGPISSVQFSSVQFSCSVMCDSLRHESQHTRPPCSSPTPRVHPNPCPSSRWCHPAISSSVIPFSSCPQSFPALESFPMSQLFTWGGQSIGVSASTSVLPTCPITSWEIDGETVQIVSGFIFGGSKITADGDCSHEIKRPLLLGRKVMTNLDSIFKSRDITLSTKVHLVKAMVFPVVMYGCESWTTKKAECRRIDAVELWCWKRLLRVPWTARRSNQSILKEISVHWRWVFIGMTDAEAETPILWPPHATSWLTGKDSNAGKDWGQEENGMTENEMARWHYRLNEHGFG